MCPNKKGAKLFEIAMLLILDYNINYTGFQYLVPAQRLLTSATLPSATPQRYSLPLTCLPSGVMTSWVEPMIEKGMAAYGITKYH